MGVHWLAENFTTFLNAAGVIGGLLFTALSIRGETKARRIGNLLMLTEHHRDLWTRIYERPELLRVLKEDVDLSQQSITEEEEIFVNLLILHLHSVYQAIRAGTFMKPEGLQQAIRWLYSRPIPRAVWEKLRPLQDRDFVRFFETTLVEKTPKIKLSLTGFDVSSRSC